MNLIGQLSFLPFGHYFTSLVFHVIAERRKAKMGALYHFVQIAGKHSIHRMANKHKLEECVVGKMEVLKRLE